MKVLLTNDDGVNARGLVAIRQELVSHFDSVVTLAPESDCSGFARKCTWDRPVRVTMVESGPHPVYSCDGTPLDCVRAGILGGVATDVGLVVSGINHGANVADDVTYSGTIGAGLEAAILGVASLCLSLEEPANRRARSDPGDDALSWDFSFAAWHGARAARILADLHSVDTSLTLSLNYPAALVDPIVEMARPGRRTYPRAAHSPFSENDSADVWLFGAPQEPVVDVEETGTDISTLRSGRISATPLSVTKDAPQSRMRP